MKINVKERPVLFLLFFLCAMGFAAYTHHAWEDYWITFRSSRNLAEGNGLVFQPGERLHTFTSPLGVLLPAAAYLLTFNSSDYAALWIFRGFSSLALGGAALMLYAMARRLRLGGPATVALLALVATDAKILDFTINGMETGVLLLFLAWTVFSLSAKARSRARTSAEPTMVATKQAQVRKTQR